MRKIIGLILLLFAFIILFCSCDCIHKTYERETFAPTCDQKGYSTYTCTDCGYNFIADVVAPYGHTFETTTIDAKCETDGYTLNRCVMCGYEEKTNIVSAKNHAFNTVIVISATCERNGYSYSICDDCGFKKTFDFIPQLSHDYQKTVTASKCEVEGYTTYTCKNCKFTYKSDYTKPTGHDYEKTYIRPNIGTDGYTLYTCKNCKSSHKSDFVFWNDILNGAAGEGKGIIAKGVDLSYHNGSVDFQKLKDNGVTFVILRIGTSKGKDTKFETYYSQAKALGLKVGGYFFTYSYTYDGAKSDAQKTLQYINGKQFDYPIFFDIEDDTKNNYEPSTEIGKKMLYSMINTYVTTMISNNYYSGVYINLDWLDNILADYKKEILGLYDVWIAHYCYDYDQINDNLYPYSATYSMWQYSDKKTFGTNAEFDINYSFKDYPTLLKKYGFSGN